MLAKRIVPCLDVNRGRVIKGVKFVDHVDAGDPVEQAKFYDQEQADELVFYDITASSDNRAIVVDMVRQVAEQVFIPFTVGGGIRTLEDITEIIQGGADKISINTAGVEHPELITQGAESFGNQCIVLSIDAKRKTSGKSWEVYIHGGRTPTGIDVIEWVQQGEHLGAGEIVANSIDSDGTKDGYDIALTRAISEAVNIPVVASGGCGNLEHIHEVLTDGKASAALGASIFHFREYSIREVKDYLAERGVVVRS
jgi:cyclase